MKLKKILTLMCCAVLLVCISVGATVAYLTSKTEVVNNTFTVGNVKITLDESPVDLYGEVVDGNRVTENEYKLIPGHEYTKDPIVHVEKGSEPSWVFVKVNNGLDGAEAEETIAAQMAKNDWTELDGQDGVYYYVGGEENGIVNALEAAVNLEVFESFTLKGDVNVESYKDASITIQAYAVQADGFATAADAWKGVPAAWDTPAPAATPTPDAE